MARLQTPSLCFDVDTKTRLCEAACNSARFWQVFLSPRDNVCQRTKTAALTVASTLRTDRNLNGGGLCDVTKNGVACGCDGTTNKKPAQMLVRMEWSASPDWTQVVKTGSYGCLENCSYCIQNYTEDGEEEEGGERSQSVTAPALILGHTLRNAPRYVYGTSVCFTLGLQQSYGSHCAWC